MVIVSFVSYYTLQRRVSIGGFPELELRQPGQVGYRVSGGNTFVGYRVSGGNTFVGYRAGIAISSVASGVCDICAGRRGRHDPKACIRSVRSSGRCTHFLSTGCILAAAAAVTISPLFEYQPANPDEAEGPDQHWKQLGRVRDFSIGSEDVDDMVPNQRQLDHGCRKGDPDEVECAIELEKKV
jgi:hypothetical protein